MTLTASSAIIRDNARARRVAKKRSWYASNFQSAVCDNTNVTPSESFRFDIGGLDHRPPLVYFSLKFPKPAARARETSSAFIFSPPFHKPSYFTRLCADGFVADFPVLPFRRRFCMIALQM
jgi:hypothetical protein